MLKAANLALTKLIPSEVHFSRINRVAAAIADRDPHTTQHAGPHYAVRRSGASSAHKVFNPIKPCSVSQVLVIPTPLAMVLAMCQRFCFLSHRVGNRYAGR